MLTPSTVRVWQRIFRDFIITIVATFILVHETVTRDDPNWYLIAAALTLYGIPPALRLDDRRRSNGGGRDDET